MIGATNLYCEQFDQVWPGSEDDRASVDISSTEYQGCVHDAYRPTTEFSYRL